MDELTYNLKYETAIQLAMMDMAAMEEIKRVRREPGAKDIGTTVEVARANATKTWHKGTYVGRVKVSKNGYKRLQFAILTGNNDELELFAKARVIA